MKCYTDIQVPKMMKRTDFGFPMIFPVAPLASQSFHLFTHVLDGTQFCTLFI